MYDDGSQDIDVIENTLIELKKIKLNSLIVIKSTVHPGNINKIFSVHSRLVYNPEFLREKHAAEDFINSSLIVFGGEEEPSKFLSNFYKNNTKCIEKNHIFTDAISASLIKYTINSYLATKVIFFNEINNLFRSTHPKESWDNFIQYISQDKRIGSSHMMVPGHDGRYGFGGACLPKDASAIVKYAESLNVDLKLIKNALNTNNQIRAKYNKKTEREDAQNIKYNKQDEE